MKELSVPATVDSIVTVTGFVNEQLEALDCPLKAQAQIDIAIDEIFSNIAHYAYGQEMGEALVRFDTAQEPLTAVITFIDEGIPFDPLTSGDPDTGLSADEREAGGLGIFMVKKCMDHVLYERRDGKNMLTIKKIIG